MGIPIIRFKKEGTIVSQFGVLQKDKIAVINKDFKSLGDLVTNGGEELKKAYASNADIDITEVELLSPVTRPCRLLCQGVNYAKHRVEAGVKEDGPNENLYFRKDESTIIGPYEDIKFPKDVILFDYEVELGIIIKKTIHEPIVISENNLLEYVAGVVLCNDMSVREWMFKQPFGQWFKGKSLRNSSPIGPIFYFFEDSEDVKLIDDLHIRLWLNDELRQDAHTSMLMVKPAQAISEVSHWVDLEPGDVLMTGTPGGVSFKMPPQFPKTLEEFISSQQNSGTVWIKPGDTIRAELVSSDGSLHLGTQENKITG